MQTTVEAQVSQGTITGIQQDGVCRFSGIPYAAAPTGERRFKAPAPAQWQGALDATRPGPIAPQLRSRLAEAMGDFVAEQSEDCLNLTVWTPGVDANKRPVVVWLHGGAWQSGAGAIDWYAGDKLARLGDVVVVGVNYRLAALGWLYELGSANLGLLDQEAAIDWVVANIAAFGGDPRQITVMGQSAGGVNVACLLARKPKFQRGLMQSAALGRGFRTADEATALTRVFLEALGVGSLAEARDLPVEALLAAQSAPGVLATLAGQGPGWSLFCPTRDGDVLPADLNERLAEFAGRADVMIGYTHDEMAAFPGMGADEKSAKVGDMIFGALSRQWAQDAIAAGRKAWRFSFDYAPTERFAACHCLELPFVFGTLDAFEGAPMLGGMTPEEGARVAREVQTAWIRFIRGESPGWDQAPVEKIFA